MVCVFVYRDTHIYLYTSFPGIESRPLVPSKAFACLAVSRFSFFFGDTNMGS